MEDKQRNNTFTRSVANYFHKHNDEININYEKDDITTNKEVYQIELCLDGKFAATFDTGKKTHEFYYKPSDQNIAEY
ncbi:hypothetical protein RhiirA5_445024 [Rhizophagus irregularis]|uniref:Uncharacterized protein n=1 Tax=Rhizophagus irregularis TaxID=588596 RepID=A0A2N0NCP2_9GLOM|nr:hypothetical protein RhiirA5_445024 [Rhizophagus irregularis]